MSAFNLKIFLMGGFVSFLMLLVSDYYIFDLGYVLGTGMFVSMDSMSEGFFFVGMFVSSSIILFSFWYMSEDVGKMKFILFMSVFLGFMFILTFSGSLLMLLVGWEGVSIMSYLLISWWGGRSEAGSSALMAILYNRVGDFSMYLGLFILVMFSANGSSFFGGMGGVMFQEVIFFLMGLFFLMGVLAKSSQFFFHPWLPSAMESPTPVSSLLHSSTMVVAGVFLIIRLFDLYSVISLWLVLFMGSLTMLYGSVSALGQTDVKKVVAYSTTSQLGLMMCSVGLGFNYLAFFHLCMHAFFKSMIFLTSGFFIHFKGVFQDSRLLGSVQTKFSFLCFVLGSMSLGGMPFFAGFYSKDLILENMYGGLVNRFMVLVVCVASVMTISYSFRVVCSLGFFSVLLGKLASLESLGVVNFLVRLLFMTLVSGFCMIFFVFNLTEESFLQNSLKMVPLGLVVSGLLMGGSYELSAFMFMYNPITHRMVLGFFYYVCLVIEVVEFFLWEFFFSKFIFLLGSGISSGISLSRGYGGLRVYIGFGVIFIMLVYVFLSL